MAGINQKRVRFFKNLIYAFIVLIMFLPLILMSFLSMRMIDNVEYMEQMLEEMKILAAQAEPYLEPSDELEEDDSDSQRADPGIPDSPAPYMTQPSIPSAPPEEEVPEEEAHPGDVTVISEPAQTGEAADNTSQISGGAAGATAFGYVPITGYYY